ncbi:MAG: PQQ-binding-like beta-propeller repeat protein [Fimbriimonadales bacterium]|nr:PQQ-binding-like beta-propeller repeat protein [Fimbriimonadales bacterium]
MMIRTNNTAVKAALIAALAISGFAFAQGPSQTHRGNNERQGINPNALDPGPGFANLRWWHPLQSTVGGDITVDNVGANYAEPTGAWFTPTAVDESPDWRGSGANPYRYAFVVPSTAGTGDPTAGATATATWTLNGTPNTNYALYVWFPTSGTRSGGILVPNSHFAVYRVSFGSGQTFTDIIPHQGGGYWARVGRNLGTQDRIFNSGPTGQITITLYNTVPRDDLDQLMGPVANHIVAADSALGVPNPGAIYASPVVRNVGPNPFDSIVVSARNESRVDPTDPDGTLEILNGRVYALWSDAPNPNASLQRWSWAPALITNANLTYDNSNPAFSADPGWTNPAAPAAPGFFGADYADAPVSLVYPGSAVARWDPNLSDDNYYDVYAWFPPSGGGVLQARAARYVIDENGTQFEFFVDQDSLGGQWVRIGNRSFRNDPLSGGLEVQVWNYSNNPGDGGRRVAADAIMLVGRNTAAIYATPTVSNVNIRRSDSTLQPTEVVFVAAEDGRVYCLDARGNGTGSTTVYWSYPSIPDVNDPSWTDPNDAVDGPVGNRIPLPGSFSVSSMLVHNIGGRDILFIASTNGRVYAIDCEGRGDYDASTGVIGTARREWTWPRATFSGGVVTLDPARPAFVASVAYDPATNQIFAAGTEGRIFALDAAGNNNQQTTLNWAWPALTDPPVGALSSTPTVGGGRVIFPSFDGRVYARDVNNSNAAGANWTFPNPPAPGLFPFTYTSVAYVPQARLGAPAPPSDMVFFVNDNGHIYGLRGDNGTMLFDSPEIQTGIQSSPYFASFVPSGLGVPFPLITFGTNAGQFLAMYANPAHSNSAGTRLAWGWQSRGETVFASPASAYGWLYHAGTDGYLYAFSTGGTISNDPGFNPPGQQIATPDDPIPGYDNIKMKFLSRPNYENLRQTPPVGVPATLPDLYPPPTVPALEWGETMYVVAYDFDYPAPPDPAPTIRFNVRGPGGLNIRIDRPAELVPGLAPGDPNSGFAVAGIPINATGNNFFTPGDQIRVDIEVIDQGRVFNPPLLDARLVTVANPIAITTVSSYVGTPPANKSMGWSTVANDPENLLNGNLPGKPLMSSAGQVIHGQSSNTNFFVADRSRILELTGQGLSNVRMIRSDAAWQGGAFAVFKPLPYLPSWEQLPIEIPNLSLDYPDIDRSNLNFISDPFGVARNPLVSPAQLRPPLNFDPNTPLTREIQGVPFQFTLNVERYQPANLTQFIDFAGDPLEGGYRAIAYIFVDSNNNGRPDGLEAALAGPPTVARREAYRELNVGGSVPVDESISIAEPTVDLGALPHSLGYTTMNPFAPGNLFVPDISAAGAFRQFFQPFTVYNEGNVNMLDLRVATRVAQFPGPNYISVGFRAEANDPLAWLDGFPNIVTNINPPYAPNIGALDASGNPRATLHKARVGDRFPTTLTVPDVPYGTTPPPNSRPVIGVAIPPGFPVGEHSAWIHVIEDSWLVGGQNDRALAIGTDGLPLEAYSDPTMLVKFNNRESRLTGGQTTGTFTHVDPSLAASPFTWTNGAPSAFRDGLGNLHMVWMSNRPQIANTPAVSQPVDTWNLFYAAFTGAAPSQVGGASPLRDLMGWTPNSVNQFWNPFQGPMPTEPGSTLFAGTPGVVVGTPNYSQPSFLVNTRPTGPNQAVNSFVFWSGTAAKDAGAGPKREHRLFYATYTQQPGGGAPQIGSPAWLITNPALEKNRIRPLAYGATGLVAFWHGNMNGKSQMFYNARLSGSGTGDQTANWSANTPIDPGAGFAQAWSPTPIERTARIDLVFTGLLRDASQPEVFYGAWQSDAFGRLRNLEEQPERNRETLVRQADGIFRARGVNWNVRRPLEAWIRRPNQAPVRIDLPATTQIDDATGVVSRDSELGGKIYFDPHTGVVRFSTQPPLANMALELRYTPRIVRVSELGATGGHSNPSSFLDTRFDWNKLFYMTSANLPISPADTPRVARMWHFYERGASGPGQAKRPYMKTQRLAIQTGVPIAVTNGVANVSVAGMVGPYYQVDPTRGKVYFGLQDEGRTVTVTFQYRGDDGVLRNAQVTGQVVWQTELAEQPVPIEQAVDEDTVFASPDLFDDPINLRTGLVWFFFTSTRAGSRDIYYISLAPKLGPTAISN